MTESAFQTLRAGKGNRAIARRFGTAAPAMLGTEPYLPEDVPLILHQPDPRTRLGILFAADAGSFSVPGEIGAAPAMTVWIELNPVSGRVELLHGLSPHHRLSVPDANPDGNRPGKLVFRRRDPDPAHAFRLFPQDPAALGVAARQLVAEITVCVAAPLHWADVLDRLRNGALRPALADRVLRIFPREDLVSLALHLMDEPGDLALLQSAIPDNPWLDSRLPALIDWVKQGRRTATADISVNAAATRDLPGANGTTAHRPDFGLALTALARGQIEPRFGSCVLGCARNEGAYLLEWIAHHRSIGFDRIFLYTNDNTDESDALLDVLARAGEITWLRNEVAPGTLPQFKAYAHALSVLPDILDFRWTLIADIDEYFGFDSKKFRCVGDFLGWHEKWGADAVALPWLLHVAATQETWHDAPTVDRFPRRETSVNHHIKTVFRTNAMWCANPHHPDASMGRKTIYLAETGLAHMPKPPEGNPSLSANPVAQNAWLAHYIFRTAPEALLKVLRGRGDNASRRWDKPSVQHMAVTFMRLSTKCALVDDLRTARCAPSAANERARLRSIPGVAACEAASRQVFIAEMRQACARIADGEPEADDLAEYRAFCRLLQLCFASDEV